MSAEVISWREEHGFDHRRRLRNGGLVSLAVHALLFATLVISPSREAPPLPDVIAVDLIGAPLIAAAPPARSAPPRRTAPPPPAPEVAEPALPPPAPKPKAPVQVLPEDTPQTVRKEKPKAEKTRVVEKPKPKVPERPRRRRGEPTKELSLEDAMAALDEEIGPDETSDLLQARPSPADRAAEAAAAAAAEQAARAEAQLASEFATWMIAAKRKIQSRFVMPSNLRGRGLETVLELRLSKSGKVIGAPKVLRSSGDPYFDDNAKRAVLKGDPLPPPPRSGVTRFVFNSEDN